MHNTSQKEMYVEAVQSASRFKHLYSSFLLHPTHVGQNFTKMPDSIRRNIAALLCILAKWSSSASPSHDVNVSQPSESDDGNVDAYHSGSLRNDSNQLYSDHSVLSHGSILNQIDLDNSSNSQAVK